MRNVITKEIRNKAKETFLRILLLFSIRKLNNRKPIFPNCCPHCREKEWLLEQGSFRFLGIIPIDHHVVTWSHCRCGDCGYIKNQSVLFKKEHDKRMKEKEIKKSL